MDTQVIGWKDRRTDKKISGKMEEAWVNGQ